MFPVLERKDKGRKRCLLSVRIRRFAGRYEPRLIGLQKSYRILGTVQSLQIAGVIWNTFYKKHLFPSLRSGRLNRLIVWLARWWIVNSTMLEHREVWLMS